MIERYTRTVMNEIWSEKTKFESMLEVELACLEAYVNEGLISIDEYNEIRTKAKVDVKRIKEIEKQTKHDVIAFTTAVCENMGSEKRWFHYGLTSTDIVDSGEGLQIKKANKILSDDICKLLSVLREKAEKYKNTFCVGRTHGQHAEVTSFGLKWLLWYDELNRAYDRFNEEIKNVEVIKISGAVGNYADINPSIEKYVSEKLNMKCSNISTQVLSRDRHIGYINSLVMISSLLEKISMEIRHLSRTEIGEVSEQFAATQKGSSAMPHKKNPIASENICGCNRLMKSYLNVAYDDNPLWDERDISHSSAERVILVDATTLLDYMLTRYTTVLENLVVNENKMLENLNMTNGVIYSSKVLLKLVSKGMLRQNAYDILQRLSFESLNKKVSLRKAIEESELKDVLTKEDLDSCFNPSEALMNIDEIYKKVFTPKAKTLVVLGSGWGDEGKGKITNYLSEQSDYVVRFQGGDNAGHTIKFNGKTYKLHLIPSGIFNPSIKNILGNGMVINPEALVSELEEIRSSGFECNNLYISDRAHVIFNYHKEMDRCNELKLGGRKIGTTLKGIGPAYTDKISRQGIRMIDFISDDFEKLFRENASAKNEEIKQMGGNPIDIEESLEKYKTISQMIKPMVVDTIELLNNAYKENKKILFEGAQGSLLDIDFGTYPYVTSSNPSSGGVSTGSGISPNKIDEVLAIVKAYSTRVGSGAFPTELNNSLGDDIRERAGEYGATTKRPRRIGWLDGVALKYSTNINGFTSISLMLLDILSGIDKLKICTAYELDGKIIHTIPASLKDYEKCKPIYEEFEGWNEDISSVTSFEELPLNAQKYIEGLERITNVPVKIFSVGPDKTQTIVRKEIY